MNFARAKLLTVEDRQVTLQLDGTCWLNLQEQALGLDDKAAWHVRTDAFYSSSTYSAMKNNVFQMCARDDHKDKLKLIVLKDYSDRGQSTLVQPNQIPILRDLHEE